MGLLVEGHWKDQWYDTESNGGKFKRQDSAFRYWLSADPDAQFPAEAGRYHLYVSYACPWAHRALIMRALKGLEDMISVSVVHWHMGENGWEFSREDGLVDDLEDRDFMYQVYTDAKSDYTGRVTVPVLWDKKTKTIVNNESAEIIRMLNTAFDDLGAKPGDYYPDDLQGEIDQVNERVYHEVNNGVYKAGFATTQSAYEEAATTLFKALDWLEERLSTQRYLAGDRLTEADLRLFTTLVRFDPVYHGHFKCNIRKLNEYPNLWAYTRDLYQQPGIKQTVFMDHIKGHYYESHPTINPSGVVPIGPVMDLDSPHGRDKLS
ncbi:glutathione S-transferase family protein [Thalassospira lucentensis]|uniref:glutathione S-transferase family protein n=1 Tax=Thalassospira lucentensis TaxID=168935 RepID=UPI00142E3A9F|nr:glutathione S-transferase family protein [Thalassospira lucentensis]NIZ01816.1 glutathione S-transferase family protein [Thalassospira lucentensis]